MSSLSLRFDRSPISKVGLVARRHAPAVEHRVATARPEVLAVARRSWEDRARQEYVGVMLMRHFHGLLVDVNAPMDVQEVALTMLVDEQRHTALAIDAARSLGSDGELSFELDELQLRRRGDPAAELLDLLLGMFVVSEVVALDLLLHTIKVLPLSSFRDVLRDVAKDEVFHARLGSLVLGSLRGDDPWMPYPGDDVAVALVGGQVQRMRSRDVVNESERELFADLSARTELEALGVPCSDLFRDAYFKSLDESVPAALQAAGIRTRRFAA
jgi:hypothetical protein